MAYKINQLTQEQQEFFKARHPDSEPMEWELMDGSLRMGFYATQEEAKEEERVRAKLIEMGMDEADAEEFVTSA